MHHSWDHISLVVVITDIILLFKIWRVSKQCMSLTQVHLFLACGHPGTPPNSYPAILQTNALHTRENTIQRKKCNLSHQRFKEKSNKPGKNQGVQMAMGRICRVHWSSFSQTLRSDPETNYLIEVQSRMMVTSLGSTSIEMDEQRFAMGNKNTDKKDKF